MGGGGGGGGGVGGGLVNSVVATWFIHVLYVGGELWVCVCVWGGLVSIHVLVGDYCENM